MRQCEHEGAAGRVCRHQGADIDIALGNNAIERRGDALIGLLLLQHQQLRFLRDDVGMSDRNGGDPRFQRQPVGIACCWVTQPCWTSLASRSQVTWARSRLASACSKAARNCASVPSAWAI